MSLGSLGVVGFIHMRPEDQLGTFGFVCFIRVHLGILVGLFCFIRVRPGGR